MRLSLHCQRHETESQISMNVGHTNRYILESADVDSERAAPVEETSVPRIDVDFLWDSVTAYKILDVDDYKYQDDDSDNNHTPELF